MLTLLYICSPYSAPADAFLVRLIVFFLQLLDFSNFMNALDPKDPLSLKVRKLE